MTNGTVTQGAMTNGTVTQGAMTNGTVTEGAMTNGTVTSGGGAAGATKLSVSYKGGTSQILVPEGIPIVRLEPADKTALAKGQKLFVLASPAERRRQADRGICRDRQGRPDAAHVAGRRRVRACPCRIGGAGRASLSCQFCGLAAAV